ncbi:MAG: hypothetical protein SVU94_12605 [Bacteroidota bacterium]|nr:hypothetical protein [Bacteroidota bacterium]
MRLKNRDGFKSIKNILSGGALKGAPFFVGISGPILEGGNLGFICTILSPTSGIKRVERRSIKKITRDIANEERVKESLNGTLKIKIASLPACHA